MPTLHDIKADPLAFQAVITKRKPWEIRLNDRDYPVGDTVTLHETQNTGEQMKRGLPLKYTGRRITGRIVYILSGYGLAKDWVVMTVDWDTPYYERPT